MWIKNHIETLSTFQNEIIHIEHIISRKIKIDRGSREGQLRYIFHTPITVWFLIELLVGAILFYELIIRKKANHFDLINFHIAYPNLTYWHKIKRWVETPVIISEHWSAYHFNFGTKKKLPRITRIFNQDIPVMAVSKSLALDIQAFSNANFRSYIIPNIVNPKIYYPDNSVKRLDYFFMVSQWKFPKKPIVALEAFKLFQQDNQHFKLKIGGYGKDWSDMNLWIQENEMGDQIELLGTLTAEEIATYLRNCKALLHPSAYETFSVVCAEAVSCHTPVIASNVGGIPEVVGKGGYLIDGFEIKDWQDALTRISNADVIEIEDSDKFNPEVVGKLYAKVIEETINDWS